MKAQSWENCDPEIRQYINGVIRLLKDVLGTKLVGVYLHGSLAMGSYYFPKSDIDLLIVVRGALSTDFRRTVSRLLAESPKKRPSFGNLEASIITLATAQSFSYPTPYEAHYSTSWHQKILNDNVNYASEGKDPDLAAHIEYVIERGVTLTGKPIDEVFNPIPWEYFIKGIIDDFGWIVDGENVVETPLYSVLNICRVIATLSQKDEELFSKDEGGQWALQNLPPEFHKTINQALVAYHSDKPVNSEGERKLGGVVWNKSELLAFRDFAKVKVEELK